MVSYADSQSCRRRMTASSVRRIVLVIIFQFSLGSFQGCYATESSRQHLAVLCLLFSSFVATATMEVALIVSGLQGICSTIPMLAKSVP